MNELQAAAKHLRETLLAASGVTALVGARVYELEAPKNATYPFVVYSLAAAGDLTQAGGDGRVIVRPRWLVLAYVARRDMGAARQIAGAVDAALEGSGDALTVDGQGYHVQTMYRDGPVERGGDVDGKFYVSAGGYYVSPVYAV